MVYELIISSASGLHSGCMVTRQDAQKRYMAKCTRDAGLSQPVLLACTRATRDAPAAPKTQHGRTANMQARAKARTAHEKRMGNAPQAHSRRTVPFRRQGSRTKIHHLSNPYTIHHKTD